VKMRGRLGGEGNVEVNSSELKSFLAEFLTAFFIWQRERCTDNPSGPRVPKFRLRPLNLQHPADRSPLKLHAIPLFLLYLLHHHPELPNDGHRLRQRQRVRLSVERPILSLRLGLQSVTPSHLQLHDLYRGNILWSLEGFFAL
jgi:hypothetical protein